MRRAARPGAVSILGLALPLALAGGAARANTPPAYAFTDAACVDG